MTVKSDITNNQPFADLAIATSVPTYGTVTVTIDEEGNPEEEEEEEFAPLIEAENYALVCRDLPFALLFYIHLAVFVWLGMDVAPQGLDMISLNITRVWLGIDVEPQRVDNISLNFTKMEDQIGQSDSITEEQRVQMEEFFTQALKYIKVYPERIVWSMAVPSAGFAFLFSLMVAVFFIKPFPRTMVYCSLIESFIIMAAVMIWASIASGSLFLYAMTAFSLVGIIYYVRIAWRMVPFAAVNLKVAVEGVTANCGLFIVAFGFMLTGICWGIYWLYVAIGVAWYKTSQCEERHPDSNFDIGADDYDSVCDPPLVVVLLFLLSLYWTTTITMNLIQITVAGVVGTWCYAKDDANHCCSFAILTSVFRSLTYSFGSVCLGSLLQAVVRLFRFIVEQARDQRDRNDSSDGCGSVFSCILECIASLLEDLIYVFNQYAYIYAGIYGLSYMESGRKVMDLFRARGWTTIISNNLIGYVMSYTIFTVGVASGVIALAIERLVTLQMGPNGDHDSFVFGPIPYPGAWAFGIGFITGTWVCAVMMNVVKGAVNTILVCWADSPTIFELNHSDLCKEMADSWTSVFPEINVYLRSAHPVSTA